MSPTQPLLGLGHVRHARLRPAKHAFAYPGYFWLLPMRALARQPQAVVRRNARGWLSFHDADHGLGQGDALAWLDALLAEAGHDVTRLAQGEVWLQTFPRVLGVVFKPVSFWWVHGPDGQLDVVVAEVNNTFGDRHAYVLDIPGLGQEVRATKVFHVSPFCQAAGDYRFRFMRTGPWGMPSSSGQPHLTVRIDHADADGVLLQTSQSGQLQALTPASARRAFWAYPLLTWGVIWRIHWHALRLWLKRVPVHTRPTPPAQGWTRSAAPPLSNVMETRS